jgi:hypothetical protein
MARPLGIASSMCSMTTCGYRRENIHAGVASGAKNKIEWC